MDLGEKIYVYRTSKNLSQGDLAELVEVSRQSVSKWETGASVPELDKLVRLCEVFDITLDELVRAEPDPQKAAEGPPQRLATPSQIPAQAVFGEEGWHRTVGLVLICMGTLIFLIVGLVLTQVLSGFLLACPFILCGLVCLLFKRNIGLWCAWVVYFCVSAYCASATGIRTPSFFWYIYYSIRDGISMGLLVSFGLLIFHVVVIVATLMRFRHRLLPLGRKTTILSIVAAVVWLILKLVVPLAIVNWIEDASYGVLRIISVSNFAISWIETVIVVWLLTLYVPHLLTRIERRRRRKDSEE